MADVLLFHHAYGLTPGCLAFADELRAAGRTVHTPDLFEGRIFASLDDGVAYADGLGMQTFVDRGEAAAEGLPPDLVYLGFSLGAVPAQALAQTRPGARGAVLLHGGLAPSVFECPWPAGVPLQVHTKEADEWVELDDVRKLVAAADHGELFVYPGSGHLFAEPGLPDYDEAAAALLRQRVKDFLATVVPART